MCDLAEAHRRALQHLRQGRQSEFFNLGSGRGYSVLEVIECARQVTGKSFRIKREPPRQGDSFRLVADSTKAQDILAWTPRQSDLPTILGSAWEWHLRHPQGYATK